MTDAIKSLAWKMRRKKEDTRQASVFNFPISVVRLFDQTTYFEVSTKLIDIY